MDSAKLIALCETVLRRWEAECRNQLVRLELSGEMGGPMEEHWRKLQADTLACLEQFKQS